jgi:hypothetical protein
LCTIRDGICGNAKYTCDYSSLPLGIPIIIPPGYTGTTFEWTCPGDVGGADAICTSPCPPGQVIDPLLKQCIVPPSDLCNNIPGLQNPLPLNTNRDPVSGNCCTQPQIWDSVAVACVNPLTVICSGAPSPVAPGTMVTWSSIVSGGTATKTYSWSGTDGLTGTSASTTKTYGTAGSKIGTVSVNSGNQNQTAVCTVQSNLCNTTTPSANSVSCVDGPVPTTNNAPNTLVNTCSISTQCDWVCSAGYYNNAGVCTPYTCQ